MTTHVEIHSFGYRRNPPPAAMITIDLRECLLAPHRDLALRELTGSGERGRRTVLGLPGATILIARMTILVGGLLQLRVPIVLAVGDDAGRLRSVVVADEVAARLRLDGWAVTVQHRDLSSRDERGSDDQPPESTNAARTASEGAPR